MLKLLVITLMSNPHLVENTLSRVGKKPNKQFFI